MNTNELSMLIEDLESKSDNYKQEIQSSRDMCLYAQGYCDGRNMVYRQIKKWLDDNKDKNML